MSDIIFTHMQVQKSDIYDTIISLLKGAGWQDISSSSANDFNVMYSKGIDGDKELYFQMRPWVSSVSYDIKTTNYPCFCMRLIKEYIPNATMGLSGTFGYPSTAWHNVFTCYSSGLNWDHNSFTSTCVCDMYYQVDANGIVVIIRPPRSTGLEPSMFIMKNLVEEYCKCSKSNGFMFLQDGRAYITGLSDAVASSLTNYIEITKYCTLAPTNPSVDGKYTMSELYFGSTAEGIRYKLSGIYFLPAIAILDDDHITVGSEEYNVAKIASGGPSRFIAYRVA